MPEPDLPPTPEFDDAPESVGTRTRGYLFYLLAGLLMAVALLFNNLYLLLLSFLVLMYGAYQGILGAHLGRMEAFQETIERENRLREELIRMRLDAADRQQADAAAEDRLIDAERAKAAPEEPPPSADEGGPHPR